MNAYIISFFDLDASEDELASYLDTKTEILNWLMPMPDTIFVVSKREVRALTRLMEKKFPDSLFIVAKYDPQNTDGLLSEEMWEFLNNPEEA